MLHTSCFLSDLFLTGRFPLTVIDKCGVVSWMLLDLYQITNRLTLRVYFYHIITSGAISFLYLWLQ